LAKAVARRMNTFFLILVIVGPLFLFALVKTGVRLIWPLLACVIAAFVGISMFVWGMSATSLADHHQGDLMPAAVYGMLIVASAAFGGLLLGVVVLARWFSGEYSSVTEGQDT